MRNMFIYVQKARKIQYDSRSCNLDNHLNWNGVIYEFHIIWALSYDFETLSVMHNERGLYHILGTKKMQNSKIQGTILKSRSSLVSEIGPQ